MAQDVGVKLKEILDAAEGVGKEKNFLLITTLKRYQVQLNLLSRLEQKIKEHGELITKEYVKGRQNLTINPAVSEYNRTATAANNTVQALYKIMNTEDVELEVGASEDDADEL